MIPVHHPIPHDYFDALVRDGTRVPAHVWRASMAGLFAATPPTELGVIHAPTVVIWGGRDDLLPPGDGAALAAAIPGAELVVYEGTGHLVLCEQPERVAREVVAMTTRLDRPV